MPWKFRRPNPIEKENDQLRTVVIQLRHELQTKQTALGGLELALQQRSNTIDNLQGTIDRLRATNQKLDAEAEHYFPDARRRLTRGTKTWDEMPGTRKGAKRNGWPQMPRSNASFAENGSSRRADKVCSRDCLARLDERAKQAKTETRY